MKTWNQFLETKHNEANAQLAPMSQQPVTAGTRPSTRRSATLNLTPAQNQQGIQQAQQAQQAQQTQQPAYGDAPTDQDVGNAYARSMINQQNMARAQMRRRV